MGQLHIGKASLSVEGIRPLKSDVKTDDASLKNQLQKDGYDEIIFQKGDQLFIAYQKNMDLSKLQVNLDPAKFDVNTAYDAGQLSVDGDAVRVLYVDDENKDSMWAQPFKSMGRAVTGLVNHPEGKSALLSFAAGATARAIGGNVSSDKLITGVVIGTLGGSTVAAMKAGAELDRPNYWDTGEALFFNAVGYGAGVGSAWGAQELGKLAMENPHTAAITIGTTALVVGGGILLDKLSDSNKPATMRVINKISAGHEVAK